MPEELNKPKLTRIGKISLVIFGLFILGAVGLFSLDYIYKPKQKQKSPEIQVRESFASRIDGKWDLPGTGFIGSVSAVGEDKKTLSITVSSEISRSAEPRKDDWLTSDERKEAIKLGFNRMEISHGDWSKSEYDLK